MRRADTNVTADVAPSKELAPMYQVLLPDSVIGELVHAMAELAEERTHLEMDHVLPATRTTDVN